MDQNKLKVLREIGYEIKKTCHFCIHSTFNRTPNWGECTANTYVHLKHSGPDRNISIHRHGSCPEFEMDRSELDVMHGWQEFVEVSPHLGSGGGR